MTESDDVPILVADTVTKLDESHRNAVLIAGSHGGVYAGYCAAKAGVRAVILNDAGVGKDHAGIGSLDYFDGLGRPAATVAHISARIGDGADMAGRGMISHVNKTAAALGCAWGQHVAECAEKMRAAPPAVGTPPVYEEARFVLRNEPGEPEVWGLDSISLVKREDEGRIIVGASHGALLAGKPDSALKASPLAAVFNDAGVGADGVGITRLPVMDQRGIAGATVAADSARIGDARSMWETGVISHVNDTAAGLGARPGMTCRLFVETIIEANRKAVE